MLTGRPGEQAKLRQGKQSLKGKIAPALTTLRRWMEGGYIGFGLLPPTLQAASAAGTVPADGAWDVGE